MTLKSIFCSAAVLFTLGLSGAGATTITYASGDTPVAIPDVSSASSTITVSGAGRVLDIDALLDITHTYDNDLVLTLSHGGASVVLSYRNGGAGGADYTNTLFDDSAASAIDAGYAEAPYTGSYRPQESLSVFNGMDIAGAWTLTAADMEAGDTGTIDNWSLIADVADAANVPEPASLALCGGALLAMGGARRRRKPGRRVV